MPSDERGQMMLLAAIVLLIAFISLSIMIARVTLVASETQSDQHGAFLREAGAVTEAMEMLNTTFGKAPYAGGSTAENLAQLEAFRARIVDLQTFEAQRGYLLTWECDDSTAANDPNVGDPAGDVLDYFRLTDGRSTAIILLRGPLVCP